MKNEKTWKLKCGGIVTITQDNAGDFVFNVKVEEEDCSPTELMLIKYKSNINVLRKMCDWMEKRL